MAKHKKWYPWGVGCRECYLWENIWGKRCKNRTGLGNLEVGPPGPPSDSGLRICVRLVERRASDRDSFFQPGTDFHHTVTVLLLLVSDDIYNHISLEKVKRLPFWARGKQNVFWLQSVFRVVHSFLRRSLTFAFILKARQFFLKKPKCICLCWKPPSVWFDFPS